MTVVFADTFYYLALANPRDAAHPTARQFSATFRGTLVTTWAVLLEFADALCQAPNRAKAAEWLDLIRADPNAQVIPISDELLTGGIELYRARPDKDWSLTDCISFVVMTELGLTDALTGDHHFEQAGFRALLQPDAGA